VIVCPNTSPFLVLARLARLDLLGDPGRIVLTRAVLAEVRDKQDDASARVDAFALTLPPPLDPAPSDRVDPARTLGAGERSVLTWALSAGPDALCILDDAAARKEARRLRLALTGTLGLVLRAKVAGTIPAAAPLLEEAVAAGLYLDDAVLTTALAGVGEGWSRRT
jgi:predicted nucleic acid-binding protein